MAELTNAQFALRAAVTSSQLSSGAYPTAGTILDKANHFLEWLESKDTNDV